MLKKLLMIFVPAAALAAPAGAQTNLHAARESLRAANAAVSAAVRAEGMVRGLAPHLADSADVLIPGAALVRGRDAAAAALSASPFAGARISWEPIRVDVSADGGSGYSFGGGARANDDGTSTPARYIAFWRREGEDWKLAAFMFNQNPRPIAPPPAGFFPEPPAMGTVAAGVDAAAALEAIKQADRDFAALAVAQNTAAAFAAFAAPDGTLLGGAYGPQAIGAAFGGGGTLEWGPTAGGMAASSDLGYTVGTAVQRGAEGQMGYTKYLSVWRLQPDGSWRWVVDGGNPRPGP